MVNIIPRASWGATPWNPKREMYTCTMKEKISFKVHYHGGIPRYDRGNANAKEIERIHLNNGWAGIGYNFVVGQDGKIREGRGWNLVGAHCPGSNRNGIGVYVAIGGDQKPTAAALAAVKALYNEACRLAGRTLTKSWHGENYPTECPGDNLRTWVKNGMKTSVATGDGYAHNVIRVGSKGADVRHAQTMLHSPNVVVDGIFGDMTRRSVIYRQRASKLVADGIVGPETWDALHKHHKRVTA